MNGRIIFRRRFFAMPGRRWIKNSFQAPPYRYPWEETNASLQALKESAGDPCDGVLLEYSNPHTGGPHFADIFLPRPASAAQGKNPDASAHQHDGLLCLSRPGHGQSVSQRIQLGATDIFVVPSWQWHSHENPASEDAILFSITDQPASEALGLYREETAESCRSESRRIEDRGWRIENRRKILRHHSIFDPPFSS